MAAALNLYAEAPDDKKPDALEKLTKLAEFTEKNWPDKPEADDARMARGKAKLVVKQVREAIDVFERVNPKSARYGLALCLAGESYWQLYVQEKLKPAARDSKQMAADRAKAVERLSAGLDILRRQADPGGPSPSFIAAQMLLAEIRLEGGDAKGAAALYQPLIDLVRDEKPQTLDEDTLRVFLGAVRAYCAAGELDNAGRAGATLLELGPDTAQADAVLEKFARLLNEERKKAGAQVTELEATTRDADLKKAKDRLASIETQLGKVLLKLAPRREVSLGGMVFLGETLGAVGQTTEASEQFQKIIQRAETDPEFAKTARRDMTRIRGVGRPAAQGRQVRRGIETGRPIDQGQSQGVGTAVGEGENPARLGGERAGPLRRGGGPLGDVADAVAGHSQETAGLLPRALRRDVQRGRLPGRRSRKRRGQGRRDGSGEDGREGA